MDLKTFRLVECMLLYDHLSFVRIFTAHPASLLVEVTHTLKIIQNIMPIVGIVKVHQTLPLKGFKTLNIVQLYSSYRN